MSDTKKTPSWVERHREWRKDSALSGSAWADPIRTRAIARFESVGLPKPRDEEWRQTNIAPLRQTDFGPSRGGGKQISEADLRPHSFRGETAAELVFVNGRFAANLSSVNGLPPGVLAESLAAALENRKALLEGHLGRYADFETRGFVAWNTAFLQDGAFVFVPAGVALPNPIHILWVSVGEREPFAAHPRALVILEPGAEATVIESYVSASDGAFLTNAVTEARVAEGASLAHLRLQAEGEKAYHVGNVQAHQEGGSRFRSLTFTFGAALSRCEIGSVLDGERGWCELDGLYVGRGDQLIDNHTLIHHSSARCDSRELYKGILTDRARGVFSGKIIVRQDAQQTDAKQTNQALLLSGSATVHAKPQLEIFADDVKCTHGATVGRLDEEAVFYLRARGIDEGDARNLLTFAFASDLTERIEFAPLRRRAEDLLAATLPQGAEIRGDL